MVEDHPYNQRIELNPRVVYRPHPLNKKGFDKNGKPKTAVNGPSQIVVYRKDNLESRCIYWRKWK